MRVNELPLCGKCKAIIETQRELKTISKRRNGKVECFVCGRYHFGGIYKVIGDKGVTE